MLRDDGHPFLAAVLDVAMAPLRGTRERVVPLARGEVIEIGIGTGSNLPLYTDVDSVVGVEPDPHMRRRAQVRADAAPFPVTLEPCSAESLPFPDATFDTAVVTFALCTIPDPQAAATELFRVLKPGGQLLFAEHTVSPHAGARTLQHALTPAWRRVAGGCRLDQDALGSLRSAGFILDVDPNPRDGWTLTPVYRGTGHKPD